MKRQPDYLLTLFRDGTWVLDTGANAAPAAPVAWAHLFARIAACPHGDWHILSDLTDLHIQQVDLQSLPRHTRQQAAQLQLQRLGEQFPWRLARPAHHTAGIWLLDGLADTHDQKLASLLAHIRQTGHALNALYTPAQCLVKPRRGLKTRLNTWSGKPHPDKSQHLLTLAGTSTALCVLTVAGELHFSRHLPAPLTEAALQGLHGTLYANGLANRQSLIQHHSLPPDRDYAALRQQLRSGQPPAHPFLRKNPGRRIRVLAILLALTASLSAAPWLLPSDNALPPSPVPPQIHAPVPACTPPLFDQLAALSQRIAAQPENRLTQLKWSCTAGQSHLLPQFSLSSDPPAASQDSLPASALPPSPQLQSWLKNFAAQRKLRHFQLATAASAGTLSLSFSSLHDEAALKPLFELLQQAPGTLIGSACEWVPENTRLNTRCTLQWDEALPPSQPAGQQFPGLGPLFHTQAERRDIERQHAAHAAQGGWIQRSDGMRLHWSAADTEHE